MKLSREEKTGANSYSAELMNRRWLTDEVFEIELTRPESFIFKPGQRIRLIHQTIERDYSLITTPADSSLALCLQKVQGGQLPQMLASLKINTRLSFTGPHGYFTHRPSNRPPVFVATGTGIAPFLSMVRSGLSGFSLIHGMRASADLFYEHFFRATARFYMPCVSGGADQLLSEKDVFQGRVTDYLRKHLPVGSYDFYLCGHQDMIRDVTLLADERFPDSLVYTETFY
jgi:ferredoxin-NADP reductase